jgi:thiol-disulfide isomerase/thioredoxin
MFRGVIIHSWLILMLHVPVFLNGQEIKVETLSIDAAAPDFYLKGIDGKEYSLSDFENYKILVVLFTCNHCPTAQAYEDKFIQAVNDFKNKNVGFVAISPNSPQAISLSELGYSDLSDDFESMKIRAKDKSYNFPYLYDGESQTASLAYGPIATPHVFIFDQNRNLRYKGRIDDTENPYLSPNERNMDIVINELLEEKQISFESTKTFGCSIKWAWKDEWKRRLLEEWKNAKVTIEEVSANEIKSIIKNDGNKYRLINLWATWCGPCVIEFPEFITIDRMYRGRDFEFISLSADKLNKKDEVLRFLKEKEASNKNYIYSGANTYNLIEAVDENWQGVLPYTLLIAPGGELIYSVDGPIDPLLLKKEIVNALGRYYADD